MRIFKLSVSTKYIFASILSGLILSACADESLLQESNASNPDAITFSAFALEGEKRVTTRSGEDALEPLALTAGADTLYLHTYEAPCIGFMPGAPVASPSTRGNQVETAEDLARFHKNFKVSGARLTDGSLHLGWSDASVHDIDNNVWYSTRTEYWPASSPLRFHAISPATEFDRLEGLTAHGGTITFGYQVPKSNGDKDAELQADLLLASYECDKQSHSGRVPLDFHHALSSVKFAVRDVLGGEVVNIKISGVNGKGRCRFVSDAEGNNVEWTDHDSPAVFSQDFNYVLSDRVVDPSDESKDEVLTDRMPEKTFMMIPQRIPEDAEIIVTFRRNAVVSPLKEEITVRGRISSNGVEEWLPGREYIYTISTSKDNWVYVFETEGNEAKGKENIFVYSPNDEEFSEFENNAYYRVKSFRYRANNQALIEILPWEASFEGSQGYRVDGKAEILYEGKYVGPSQWITDKSSIPFKGNGSTSWDLHEIEMYPHHVVTDWEGDKVMQLNKPYSKSMLSENTPYDLSTFGGKRPRSTANCYVIDRGGWYSLPLVYGNAIVNGGHNTSSYKCTGKNSAVLATLIDYKGSSISGSAIKEGKNAELLWQDAYNMISNVSIANIGGEMMLRFYVDNSQLQQGNAVVALKDASGEIVWSWHIWATEHWLDSEGLPNAISSSAEFKFNLNSVTKIREKGDAKLTFNQEGSAFYMSPYNLGWCDPKSVAYLKRKSVMKFKQYLPGDPSKPVATASLDIIQQGVTVNYKIGNNTYYQFGRKDPQVGFVDRNKNFKANFGPTPFGIASNASSSIKDGIRKPHIMFVHTGVTQPPSQLQDWTNPSYINLWNNSSNVSSGYSETSSLWSHVKTVYDPSPVGYVVPNAGIWRALGKGAAWNGSNYENDPKFGGGFNGVVDRKIEDAVPDGINVYKLFGDGNSATKESFIYLVPTGNRWYSNGHSFKETEANGQETDIKAGLNFNLRMFYGWSSRWHKTNPYAAYSAALGMDGTTGNKYFLAAHFDARRAMGRPVRAIRDPNFLAIP